MKKLINYFIPYIGENKINPTLDALQQGTTIHNIYLLNLTGTKDAPILTKNILNVDGLWSTTTLRLIAKTATAPYCLFYTKTTPLQLGYHALERLVRLAEDSQAPFVYADHDVLCEG